MRLGHVVQIVPDAISILPVAQQVVGALTVLAATVGLVVSITQRVFHGMARSVHKETYNNCSTLRNAMMESGKDKERPDLFNKLKEECEVYAVKFSQAHIECDNDNREMANNLRMVGIGILRMIPVVGTCVSIYRVVQLRKEFYKTEQVEFTQRAYQAPGVNPKELTEQLNSKIKARAPVKKAESSTQEASKAPKGRENQRIEENQSDYDDEDPVES